MQKAYKLFVLLGVLSATAVEAAPRKPFPTPEVRGAAAKGHIQRSIVAERINVFRRDFETIDELDDLQAAIDELNSLQKRIERTLYFDPRIKQLYFHNMEQERILMTMLGSVRAKRTALEAALGSERGVRPLPVEPVEPVDSGRAAREAAEQDKREAAEQAAREAAEQDKREAAEREAREAAEQAAREAAEREAAEQASIQQKLAYADALLTDAHFGENELNEVLEALRTATEQGVDSTKQRDALMNLINIQFEQIWKDKNPRLESAEFLLSAAARLQEQESGISFAPGDRLIADYINQVKSYKELQEVFDNYPGRASLEELRTANEMTLQERDKLVGAGLKSRLTPADFVKWGVPGIEQIERTEERRGGIMQEVRTSTYGQLRGEVAITLAIKGRAAHGAPVAPPVPPRNHPPARVEQEDTGTVRRQRPQARPTEEQFDSMSSSEPGKALKGLKQPQP